MRKRFNYCSFLFCILIINFLFILGGQEAISYAFTLADVEKENNVKFNQAAREIVKNADAIGVDNYVKQLKAVQPEKTRIDPSDLGRFEAIKMMYGRLRLSSVPQESEVFLDSIKEGITPIYRVYPVGSYVFKLVKDKCEPKDIPIQIKRDSETKENVKLVCR